MFSRELQALDELFSREPEDWQGVLPGIADVAKGKAKRELLD